jgi:hypothetical protein
MPAIISSGICARDRRDRREILGRTRRHRHRPRRHALLPPAVTIVDAEQLGGAMTTSSSRCSSTLKGVPPISMVPSHVAGWLPYRNAAAPTVSSRKTGITSRATAPRARPMDPMPSDGVLATCARPTNSTSGEDDVDRRPQPLRHTSMRRHRGRNARPIRILTRHPTPRRRALTRLPDTF